MGKKKTVMRRLAALLIASLVVTSSAFTSLAAATREVSKQPTISAIGGTTRELQVGGTTVLQVKVDDDASVSDASKSEAAEAVVWSVNNDNVVADESGLLCTVTAEKVGTSVVTAKTNGSSVEFTITVKANEDSGNEDPAEEDVTAELDKTELVLTENESDTLTVTVEPKDAEVEIEWHINAGENDEGEGIVQIIPAGNSVTVVAKKAGEVEVGAVIIPKGKNMFSRWCHVTVEADTYEKEEGEAEVVVDVPELPEEIAGNAEVVASVVEQRKAIVDEVREITKEAAAQDLVDEGTKSVIADVLAAIEGLSEEEKDAELKLITVKANLVIEKDKNDNPILDEDGNPLVVVDELIYDIGLVSNGTPLDHGLLENNTTDISVTVKLPKKGMRSEWMFATILHYANAERLRAGDWLEKWSVPIEGEGEDRSVTITTRNFSLFVMNFSKENPNPPATPSNSSGNSSGGGGSRSTGMSGGSSANSYAMSGSWQLTNGVWKFLKTDGSLATSTWGFINGQYYYFDAEGNMVTGWYMVNGKWYYMNPQEGLAVPQGAMLTGWLMDPAYNAWFLLTSNGDMLTGWQEVGGKWYYLNPVADGTQGAMAADTYVDGYYVGADGAWVQ